MKKVLLFVSAALLAASSATAQVTVDFEEFNLEENSYNLGKTLEERAFVSNGFRFYNGYADYDGWDYYDGFAISSRNVNTFDRSNLAADQFNSCTGTGADKSKTFAVLYYSTFGGEAASITNNEGRLFTPQSVALTNNAYAFNSLTSGDSFAKRFTEDDWFQLYIIGKKNGVVTDTVTVNLAADGMLNFAWKTIDLTALGEVDRIEFSMNSTDVGAYGMNTPAYCCFDNFVSLVGETTGAKNIPAPVSNASVDGILSPEGKRINALQKGMNILLMSDGTTRKIFK